MSEENNHDSPSCSDCSGSDSDCLAGSEHSAEFRFSPESLKEEVKELYRDFRSMKPYVEQRPKSIDQMQAEINELRKILDTSALGAIYSHLRTMSPVIYRDSKTKEELYSELYSLYQRICKIVEDKHNVKEKGEEERKKWKSVDQIERLDLIVCFELCREMRDCYDAGSAPVPDIDLWDDELLRDLQHLRSQLENYCCFSSDSFPIIVK